MECTMKRLKKVFKKTRNPMKSGNRIKVTYGRRKL